MRNYLKELDDLKENKITKIKITNKEFMDFRSVWINYPHHQDIVGIAQKNGDIVYSIKHD